MRRWSYCRYEGEFSQRHLESGQTEPGHERRGGGKMGGGLVEWRWQERKRRGERASGPRGEPRTKSVWLVYTERRWVKGRAALELNKLGRRQDETWWDEPQVLSEPGFLWDLTCVQGKTILHWPTTEHGACCVTWLIYPGTLHWRKLISPILTGISCK